MQTVVLLRSGEPAAAVADRSQTCPTELAVVGQVYDLPCHGLLADDALAHRVKDQFGHAMEI